MPAAYKFLDRWTIPAPIEEAYEVLGDVLSYPRWWQGVYLEATGDAGPPKAGNRNDVVTKGFLPYKLRWTIVVAEVEPPRRIFSRASGDFEGTAEWRLEAADGTTRAELDWRPLVNKPGVRELTPVLRPLFRANHLWAMNRGERQLAEYLRQRRA